VRSSSDETGTNEQDVSPDIENQYVNAVAVAAARDEHSCTTGVDGDQCQALYQDLNIGAGSAEPIVYETIKPRVLPKPARRADTKA